MKKIILRNLFLILLFAVGTSLQAQILITETNEDRDSLRYSCMQISTAPGHFPRVIVDKNARKISLEYDGYVVSDVYQFQDTLSRTVDTLDHPAPEMELFVDENKNSLIWEDVSKLAPLDKEQIDECLLSDNEEDQILRIKPFQYGDKKGVLVILKRETKLYDEERMAHICVPFFYDEENCEYVEECGAIFWNDLEKIYITEIIHNNFPIILALEGSSRHAEGKGMRIIFNRIKNE